MALSSAQAEWAGSGVSGIGPPSGEKRTRRSPSCVFVRACGAVLLCVSANFIVPISCGACVCVCLCVLHLWRKYGICSYTMDLITSSVRACVCVARVRVLCISCRLAFPLDSGSLSAVPIGQVPMHPGLASPGTATACGQTRHDSQELVAAAAAVSEHGPCSKHGPNHLMVLLNDGPYHLGPWSNQAVVPRVGVPRR